MKNKIDILSLSKNELRDVIKNDFKDINIETFRADQIYSWIYKNIGSFFDITNISERQKKIFDDYFYIGRLKAVKKLVSSDGTIKYLFELHDGNKIESVFMRYNHGNTVCVSTQVGCRMGCAFCASAIGGISRNLLPSEMLLQVMTIEKDVGERISNIVLMGIGEPLDNFDNVLKFLGLVNSKDCLNIGYRHISLSTCGLVDKINKLKEINIPITLSVSLHAPNDMIRKKIMPVSNKWSIDELLKSCEDYANYTKRRISFEYTLIERLNDSVSDAYELASKIKNILCHVNLILINKVAERNFSPPSVNTAQTFQKVLENNGVNVTFRRKCGNDIDASCGQLRMAKNE
ncbi:MAG: 23S rRNA (adenine(2503)-C(2))-methyltransferase RlmN [Oscillospiraceae bacterium]|nr:23S rRNA (adenine(2503)-C(2))-methyltransferase RlmN [Oscillospiraceae bacterium]